MSSSLDLREKPLQKTDPDSSSEGLKDSTYIKYFHELKFLLLAIGLQSLYLAEIEMIIMHKIDKRRNV